MNCKFELSSREQHEQDDEERPQGARSPDRSGFDSGRRALAQQRESFAGTHREVRARRVGRHDLIDDAMREIDIDSVECGDRIDARVFEQLVRNVLARRQRWEVAFFVRFGMPRSALSEHGRVIIPRTETAIVPDEVIAHAGPAANRTLHERLRRVRERIEEIFRKIVDVDERGRGQLRRNRCVPTDARKHFEIAHRCDERSVIVGCERRVGPCCKVVGGDVDALPILAEHAADRRPTPAAPAMP